MSGLSVDIAANTRAAQASVKDLSGALDAVADALDDVAADAQRGGAKTERALDGLGDAGTDAARELERSGDRVERTFRDMVQDAGRAEAAVKQVGDDGPKSLRRLGDAGAEVSGELRQNLGETFSSFKGDLADLPQIAQDTLGGLAGSGALGGIPGLALTAAGAAGLGMITAELTKQQEQADALRDRLASAYQSAVAEGRTYLDTAQLIAEAQDLMFDPERADQYKSVMADAGHLALEESTMIAAAVGDLEAQQEVLGRIGALQAELAREQAANGGTMTGEMRTQWEVLKLLENEWSGLNDTTRQTADTAVHAQEVTSRFLLDAIDKAGTAQQQVDEFGNQLLTLPDGTEVVIDAKTGRAHQDLDAFKGDLDGVSARVTPAQVRVQVDDSAWKSWRPPVKHSTVKVVGPTTHRWEF